MIGCEFDLLVNGEDAFPFFLGLVKQSLDAGLKLGGCVLVSEAKIVVAAPITGKFVVEFREDELEDFLKYVDAGISEYFVFEIFNQFSKRTGLQPLRFALLLLVDECLDCPLLTSDVLNLLRSGGYFWNLNKIVRVLPVPNYGLRTIAPNGKGCPGCVRVAAELFLAVFKRRLLHFDDEVWDRRTIGVEYDD